MKSLIRMLKLENDGDNPHGPAAQVGIISCCSSAGEEACESETCPPSRGRSWADQASSRPEKHL